MSAGAPWSVKGIDPKAREIAKDLARRSGMTLGEWLNQMIIEGDAEESSVVPLTRRTQAPYLGGDRRGRLRRLDDAYDLEPEDESARVTRALEELTARIEAAENRSTLAVSGVNQAVSGLLARLEHSERGQSTNSARLEQIAEELRDEQGRVLDRVRLMEHEATGPRSVEALRALETSLGKIANQLYEGDARTRASLAELRTDLTAVSRRVDRAEAQGPESAVLIDGVVARIAGRLEQAESRTAGALRALESSFAHLDDRLRTAESRLEADRETRFEKLAGELSQRVEEARHDMLRRLDSAADGRFDKVERALADLSGHVQDAEKRSAQAIEKMGHEVVRIAQNLNRRMTEVEEQSAQAVEQIGGEMTKVVDAVEERLRRTDDGQAQALEKLGAEIARISDRLSERIAHAERRQALSADDMGERIGRVADKLEARYERASGELADRIRQSEERTARLLDEARETIDRGLVQAERRAQVYAEAAVTAAVAAAAPAEPAESEWMDAGAGFEAEASEPAFDPVAAFDTPAPAFPFVSVSEAEPEPVFVTAPEPRFELKPAAEAESFEAPAVEPKAFGRHDTLGGRDLEDAFEDFGEESPFVGEDAAFGEAAPARPALSTKEAIDAARAAARLGVRNRDEGSSFTLNGLKPRNRLQQRVEKESKREPSTVKKALLASATAATLTSALAGYWLLFADPQHARPEQGGLKLVDDEASPAHTPTTLAAVALAPSGAPKAEDAQSLFHEGQGKLAAQDATGAEAVAKAANLGYAPAQTYLGHMYESGEGGVAVNMVEARRWTERAAEGGDPQGMNNLGKFLYDGVGGPKDIVAAAQWIRKAAERDLVDAQFDLASLYERGDGVPASKVEAYKWYLVAAGKGDKEARREAQRVYAGLTWTERADAARAASAFRAGQGEPSAYAAR